MKRILRALIVVFSLCIVALVSMQTVNMVLYMGLILIDYFLILLLNDDFRKTLKKGFRPSKTFGSDNKVYGQIHLKTLEEDLEKIEPLAFEVFIGDLFKALGYKVRVTEHTKDFGGDVIARKDKEIIVIQVKHRNSADKAVSNDAVQQAVAAMPVYRANLSMVVTNGTFTQHACEQAAYCRTIMIDGKQLIRLVQRAMKEENQTQPSNSESDEGIEISTIEIPTNKSEETTFNQTFTGTHISQEDKVCKVITRGDCIEEQLESVLSDTIPEVILEERLEKAEREVRQSTQEQHKE